MPKKIFRDRLPWQISPRCFQDPPNLQGIQGAQTQLQSWKLAIGEKCYLSLRPQESAEKVQILRQLDYVLQMSIMDFQRDDAMRLCSQKQSFSKHLTSNLKLWREKGVIFPTPPGLNGSARSCDWRSHLSNFDQKLSWNCSLRALFPWCSQQQLFSIYLTSTSKLWRGIGVTFLRPFHILAEKIAAGDHVCVW